MDDEDKAQFLTEFKKVDGATKLDMWDFALGQQVLWDQIITELTEIARKQGVDKKLEKLAEENLKNIKE